MKFYLYSTVVACKLLVNLYRDFTFINKFCIILGILNQAIYILVVWILDTSNHIIMAFNSFIF